MSAKNPARVRPYLVGWGPKTGISRNPYTQDRGGLLLLSLGGDQNPDPDCGSSTCFQAQITETPTGRYELYWTDQVANDWSEEYDDLSVALLRLAGIVHSFEGNFEQFFTSSGAKDFADNQAPAIFNHLLK